MHYATCLGYLLIGERVRYLLAGFTVFKMSRDIMLPLGSDLKIMPLSDEDLNVLYDDL
jgi:hypothetical protein